MLPPRTVKLLSIVLIRSAKPVSFRRKKKRPSKLLPLLKPRKSCSGNYRRKKRDV